MPDDADLSLSALATTLAEFLTELDLHQVTMVCNDWGGAQLLISPGGTDGVASLVLVSCEAFDNYPPGLPGRLLCATAAMPGGTFLVARLLGPRWIRHLPVIFGALSKRRVPKDLFRNWIHPLRQNPKVRRDLRPQRPGAAVAARLGRPAARLPRYPHRTWAQADVWPKISHPARSCRTPVGSTVARRLRCDTVEFRLMISSQQNPHPSVPADALIGTVLDGGWRVEGRAPRLPDATGGNFSTCYLVTNVDLNGPLYGQQGFLKALDYSAAASGPDMTRALENLTAAYNFERDLIDLCNRRRMRHVVKGIAHGEHRVTGFGPVLDRVSYLIFEAAQHDLREALTLSTNIDLTWTFRTLHNTANGLRQLHTAKVFHQDLKPSNVLEFGESRKIGDLGRAHRTGTVAPHDVSSIPGDHTYAPPELLYRYVHPDGEIQRRATDLYQLGSLLYFLFTKASVTTLLLAILAPAHRPAIYGGTYQQVLPELRQAFDLVVLDLEACLPAICTTAAVDIFRELADPDILERGVPRARKKTADRLSLDRYVSRFDNLARRAEIAVSQSLR